MRANLEMEKVNILGIEVNALNMNDAVSMIKRWLENREQRYVCVAYNCRIPKT